MNKQVLAGISVSGTTLDLLGGLYLAYELLGGKHGPLRILTRVVTYSLLFGIAFALSLGLGPGLLMGLGLGGTVGHEFDRAARGKMPAHLKYIVIWSFIRSACFGAGGVVLVNWKFGLCFGLLSLAGQLFAYRLGFAPTAGFQPDARPRLNVRQLVGAVNRTIGYGLAGALSGLVSNDPSRGIWFGIVIGTSVGIASVVLSATVPFIEWKIERMPDRRMGLIGAGLVVIGFMLQSLQYWLVLLNIPVN